ncbi:MAG: hypothetical protein LWW86_08520 [Micrococcales bacterium]|nr:hypothetical protein [Micrococcales bacterium]
MRPGRIVQTFTYAAWPDDVSLETLTLEDQPDGRCLLRTSSAYDNVEARDRMIASGCESGIQSGYAALDQILKEQSR